MRAGRKVGEAEVTCGYRGQDLFSAPAEAWPRNSETDSCRDILHSQASGEYEERRVGLGA